MASHSGGPGGMLPASKFRDCACAAPQLQGVLDGLRAGDTTKLLNSWSSQDNSASSSSVPTGLGKRVTHPGLHEAGFHARGFDLQRHKREALGVFFRMSHRAQAQILLLLRENVKKSATADADMPAFVEKQICNAIDSFWHDIMACMENTMHDSEEAMLDKGWADHQFLAQTGERPCCLSPRWYRAQILYRWAPFDLSFFGQAKDPIFWILTILSMTTQYGIRVIFISHLLVLICLGVPPDEYQLVNFILTCKGSQFISSGIGLSLVAAVKYYQCVDPNGTHTCNTTGPAAGQDLRVGVLDFVGSIVICWVAFLLLPFSGRAAGSKGHAGGEEPPAQELEHTPGVAGTLRAGAETVKGTLWNFLPHRHLDMSRGGRLGALLVYDLVCFVLAVLLFIGMAVAKDAEPDDNEKEVVYVEEPGETHKHRLFAKLGKWRFGTEFFYARIFYGLLTAPFLVCGLPVLSGILTHTLPTGFNRQGLCVPYMLRPKGEKPA